MNNEVEEYSEKIVDLLNENDFSFDELQIIIQCYHESDIADALEELTQQQRRKIYDVLSDEELADIFSYLEDPAKYIAELKVEEAAEIISEMDSDDAVEILEEIDDKLEDQIIELMDEEASEDVLLIQSYQDEQIGSRMTTNYIEVKNNMTIKQVMKEMIAQAQENDNISTIYVSDVDGKFYGAIDIKDLIIARAESDLEDIITNSYPTVHASSYIEDVIVDLVDYSEDSFPVLDENDHIIGIITATDLVDVVDEEISDDYAKLGGLSEEEDLDESIFSSVKKRIPWLIVLLFLGMGVSSVVGVFEKVVEIIPLVVCFQSLVLDMAGNVGTQSLAVTIRVLTNEDLSFKDKLSLVMKEVRVGLVNGLVLGTLSLAFITVYIMFVKQEVLTTSFLIAVCVGVALLIAMVASSLIGTIVPLVFNAIHVDPAVASGPLITTVNDLVSVVSYYGLAGLLLINILHIY